MCNYFIVVGHLGWNIFFTRKVLCTSSDKVPLELSCLGFIAHIIEEHLAVTHATQKCNEFTSPHPKSAYLEKFDFTLSTNFCPVDGRLNRKMKPFREDFHLKLNKKTKCGHSFSPKLKFSPKWTHVSYFIWLNGGPLFSLFGFPEWHIWSNQWHANAHVLARNYFYSIVIMLTMKPNFVHKFIHKKKRGKGK